MNAQVALPYLSACRVSGTDTFAFLHAQLAADIAGLSDGQSTFAAFCSARGQVICLLRVQRRGNEASLIGAAGLLDQAVQRLRRFVLRSDVRFDAMESRVAGMDSAPEGESPDSGLDYAVGTGVDDEAAATAWKARELRRGVLWLDSPTSERFIPQMLGLERIGAVSFSKGCYPGQEVVARARYLGTVKRQPALLRVQGPASPRPGQSVMVRGLNQNAEGTVIDSAPEPDAQGLVTVVVTSLAADEPVAFLEFESGIRLGGERIDR